MNLVQRRDATRATWDRFRNRPFDWSTGGTCLHLARAQLKSMGHKPPRIPPFRSPLGARRAMTRAGFGDLASIFESMLLPEIAPAHMLVGDLAILTGEPEDGFDAVGIWSGAQVLAYHGALSDGVKAIVGALDMVDRAFRL